MDLRSKDAIESSKQHDIQMGNILIAEFMGSQEHEGSYYLPLYNSGDWVPDVELEYHTSWDWLMPVVMKISRKTDKPLDEVVSRLTEVGSDNIWGVKSLHNAVVEFIKDQSN